MRYSQVAIFIVANQSKALNLIFSSPYEVIYDRVSLFNYILSKANKGCSKQKFMYNKCRYDLNFSRQKEDLPIANPLKF